DFENFPRGTTPHTTAPFDYLIVLLSVFLATFTTYAVDLAGALVSPLLALAGGWFLWCWARGMNFRYVWPTLILFAASPILVHGTELGRPDHQSLLIVLLMVALCAEWSLLANFSKGWSVAAGCAWGMALWVSLYEPFILLALVVLFSWLGPSAPETGLFSRRRGAGWLCFFFVLLLALLVERRLPSFSGLWAEPYGKNWMRSLGELQGVPFLSITWFRWAGCLVAAIPLLIWVRRARYFAGAANRRRLVLFLGLLGATFLLTLWQARWGYFFALAFAVTLPPLLAPFSRRWLVWTVFVFSLWPMAREWDERLWPNELEQGRRTAEWRERIDLRELAVTLRSTERHPFLAPWWLSPALVYWSGQPAVAGSSHESLGGISDSARFYATEDWQKAREIMENRQLDFVFAYDADRVAATSAQILGHPIAEHAVCYILDRAPAVSPSFLVLAAQNPAGKIFRVANNR
ncbi:MAG TPA: hypothetical protein VGG94_03600, partial [Chthoniobacterales bacterium]